MAVIVKEAAEGSPSITSRPPTCKRKYKVWGTPDSYIAKTAVKNYVPYIEIVENSPLYLLDISLDRVGNADDVWEATAAWGLSVFPLSFDTSGGTTKATHSLETVGTYEADGVNNIPDFQGGIGFNGDAMEGCDITIPQFSWTESHTFKLKDLNWDYVKTLANITGKTNQAPFRGFAAGEVLFMGASGGWQKNELECDIQYKFSASPNRTDIKLPGFTGNISKGGWNYLWIYYKGTISKGANQNQPGAGSFRIAKPLGCYIEKVYDNADFGLLKIDQMTSS